MNKVILIGRLTKDPELKTGNTPVCNFTVAVDRGKDKDGNDRGADFPRITVFGKQAENCHKYLTKGRQVAILGRIQTGSFEKDGQKYYTTDVVGDQVEFLGSKGSDDGVAKYVAEAVPTGFSDISEDIPF